MTAVIIRFPLRRVASILIVREHDGGGCLALCGCWLFGSRDDAIAEAKSLVCNFGGAPVREAAP
jgi:hypothetical protein